LGYRRHFLASRLVEAAVVDVAVRETTEGDLDFVLALETEPEAARLVGQWTRDRHREAIGRADEEHLLILAGENRVGYALLQGVGDPNRSIEIRRIVVGPRGAIGRRALRLIVDRSFRRHAAHRVWLDTFPWNERARRAYAAAGFVREGTLRDVLLKNGRFESLVVMSILRPEWELGTRRQG
jgi:diamine N-acetyltransferase